MWSVFLLVVFFWFGWSKKTLVWISIGKVLNWAFSHFKRKSMRQWDIAYKKTITSKLCNSPSTNKGHHKQNSSLFLYSYFFSFIILTSHVIVCRWLELFLKILAFLSKFCLTFKPQVRHSVESVSWITFRERMELCHDMLPLSVVWRFFNNSMWLIIIPHLWFSHRSELFNSIRLQW